MQIRNETVSLVQVLTEIWYNPEIRKCERTKDYFDSVSCVPDEYSFLKDFSNF